MDKIESVNNAFASGAGYTTNTLQILITGVILISICVWAIYALSNAIKADIEPLKKIHKFLVICLFASIMIIIVLAL